MYGIHIFLITSLEDVKKDKLIGLQIELEYLFGVMDHRSQK